VGVCIRREIRTDGLSTTQSQQRRRGVLWKWKLAALKKMSEEGEMGRED